MVTVNNLHETAAKKELHGEHEIGIWKPKKMATLLQMFATNNNHLMYRPD